MGTRVPGARGRPLGTARTSDRFRGPRRATAIAVLIVAFLGALMWVGFQQIWANAEVQTNEQITQIGG